MIALILAQTPPEGIVSGGWGYVAAAYLATWICFAAYAASLVSRRKAAEELTKPRPGEGR